MPKRSSDNPVSSAPSAPILDTPDGALLTLHIQPNARRTEYVGIHGDALKVKVAAPPVEGAANDTLRRFLSECCHVSLKAIEIQTGAAGRRKRVLIRGVSAAEIEGLFMLS